jgi:hypothetical protein
LAGVSAAAFFKVDDVAGMVNNAHRIRFGVTDTKCILDDITIGGRQAKSPEII